MKIKNNDIYLKATRFLKEAYGDNANFREGQYEAIEATCLNKRTLVIQRTGWGKSLIYFIVTKILKEKRNLPTLIVSPLLSLMENQMEMSKRFNLNTIKINCKIDKKEAIKLWENNIPDIIFITPESLFSELVQKKISNLKIGLFVVDEAHCISDWGHDFRLEYFRLKELIKDLPENVPVLATTATANDRVKEDLKKQLGGELYISKGSLIRKSLNITVLDLKDQLHKYAWILKNINKLKGVGIIYCLTHIDCERLADFLVNNGVNARAYYSRNDKKDEIKNDEAISLFENNEIKVLVATVKLGMGYDKDDIGFIINYQMPCSIIAYYQQIGRAGRKLENADVILLKGKQDEDIINYFIEDAFPSEICERSVYNEIQDSDYGLKLGEIENKVNFSKNNIKKSIRFLENNKFIYEINKVYNITNNKYKYNIEHYQEISNQRILEKNQMLNLISTDICYMKYILKCLDEDINYNCMKCSNCLKKREFFDKIEEKYIIKARKYLSKSYTFLPRKKNILDNKPLNYINEEGIYLARYGAYGYGKAIKEDKYNKNIIIYREEIISQVVNVLKEKIIDKEEVKYITFVPSRRNKKLENLVYEVANRLGIECLSLFDKEDTPHQKEMNNSKFQCKNAKDSFKIKKVNINIDKIILIDDIVDSKWTLTWCGYYLKENGIEKVFPFALANSSIEGGD